MHAKACPDRMEIVSGHSRRLLRAAASLARSAALEIDRRQFARHLLGWRAIAIGQDDEGQGRVPEAQKNKHKTKKTTHKTNKDMAIDLVHEEAQAVFVAAVRL